jgi:hypothetical protein
MTKPSIDKEFIEIKQIEKSSREGQEVIERMTLARNTLR